jgi:hypothetical protein
MSYTRNYVIAGGRGGTPSSLSMKMEPVKLDTKMGVALKSLACGELANVTDFNNTFKILYRGTIKSHSSSTPSPVNMVYSLVDTFEDSHKSLNTISSEDAADEFRYVSLRIPKKRYERREEVFMQVTRAITNFLIANGSKERVDVTRSQGKLSCVLPKSIMMVRADDKSPLTLIDAVVISSRIYIDLGEIEPTNDICFIYLNIVQFSYINGKRSRLLCVCPIQSKKGYSYIEFSNPTYTPIEVQEFSDITLTIRNIHGQLLQLDNRFDTVATLHMKKMKN